jgi:ATP-binding cassette subfamily F protein uup
VPPVISVREISHRYGVRPLFEGVSFTLGDGERVGLIGPNGAGKSTLLKILAGIVGADRGDVVKRSELRVAYVEQVPTLLPTTAHAAVASGLDERSRTRSDGDARVSEWLNRLELDPDVPVSTLSGGWQKRVAFGKALVSEPELLLLDEPTNHLDVESILWLERLLANSSFATLTVTHDRLFLQRV